jgi:import inner membrane translocase subunit TIM23
MSFLSGLFGGGDKSQSIPTPESSPSSDLFASTSFQTSTTPQPPNASSQSSPGPSTFSEPQPIAPTALDTFTSAFDPAKLHPLAGLGDKLDFLQLDDDKLTEVQGAASVLPSRGWTDDLCVGTGTTYLSGWLSHCGSLLIRFRACIGWNVGTQRRVDEKSGSEIIHKITSE